MKKILILMAVALGFTSTSCARTAPKAEAAEATQVETTTGVPSTVKIVPTSITGDHYRLTKQQWQNLCTDLNIPGIPAYVLLNKDGSVGFSNLTEGGYPGNDVIQNNLEVAISK